MRTLICFLTYLGVGKLGKVWVQIKAESICRPIQSDTPDYQDGQYHVGEGGSEIHNLQHSNILLYHHKYIESQKHKNSYHSIYSHILLPHKKVNL